MYISIATSQTISFPSVHLLWWGSSGRCLFFNLWPHQVLPMGQSHSSLNCSDCRKGCYFHTKCLLLVFIDSLHRRWHTWGGRSRCSLSSDGTEVSNRWPRASGGSSARTSSLTFFFDMNSHRSSDSSSTRVVDPAGRGTFFTEAITPSADVSESSSSAVTITYITKKPVVLWEHPWPSRRVLVSLTQFELWWSTYSVHALWKGFERQLTQNHEQ